MLRFLGKLVLATFYAAIPIVGWYFLAKSFKRVKAGSISVVQNFSGSVEILDKPGIYFRPFPGDNFGKTFLQTEPYIDFGSIKRVFVKANQAAVKMDEQGVYKELQPGYNIINPNETYFSDWLVDSTKEDYTLGQTRYVTIQAGRVGYAIDNKDGSFHLLNAGKHVLPAHMSFGGSASLDNDVIDFNSYKIVRIKQGFLGVKINSEGYYEVLPPGIHAINVAKNETFDPKTGIQNVGEDDFTLGDTRYVRIRNGELGESYNEGKFVLLEPGEHKLSPKHIFVKKASINDNIVNLGALKIVTVKEGQVAIINTKNGISTQGPGKYHVKQEEGDNFDSIITTSLQGLTLDPLNVICSDQIEMTAKSMVMYEVKSPLKTVGLGIDTILRTLKEYADGILRSILSRFNSNDLSPPIHQDNDHNSEKRAEKLKEVHDNFVKSLNEKAENWGLAVTDLQITEILPTNKEYLTTLQSIGTQQVKFEAQKQIAASEAQIAKIKAEAEKSMVIAAENEQSADLIKAKTKAQTMAIAAEADAQRTTMEAQAEAKKIQLIAAANNERIVMLNKAMASASLATQKIMLIEAEGKVTATVMANVKDPIFIQPDLGHTHRVMRDSKGLTLFSSHQGPNEGKNNLATDLLILDEVRRSSHKRSHSLS